MVGIVIVSHSWKIAEGVKDLARQVASPDARIVAAGGMADGEIGTDALSRIVNHPALRDLPFCLETPHDQLQEYAQEIALVRGLTK